MKEIQTEILETLNRAQESWTAAQIYSDMEDRHPERSPFFARMYLELSPLVKQGLIEEVTSGGRRKFRLTATGRASLT